MFSRFFQDPVADMSTAVARAEAGARFLDDTYGEEWHHKIDVSTLNIASPMYCVLGQLLRKRHWRIAFLSLSECVALGFSCGLWDFLFFAKPPWVSRSFHRLDEAWKLVLENRLVQDAQPKPRPASWESTQNGRDDSDQNRFTCVN